jgi:hypothetical protein
MADPNRIRNSVLLFLVQSVHSLVFWGVSASVFYVLYSAMVNRVTRWTKLAIGSVVVEGAILILYGWRCPLRIWAEALGAERGSVTDIFLPRWLADRIFQIYTPLFLMGCLALAARRLYSTRR